MGKDSGGQWRLRTAKPPYRGGPDPTALIRIRDRPAAQAEALAPQPDGVFVRIYTITAILRHGRRSCRLKVSADRDGLRLDGSEIDRQERRALPRFIAT